jgi:HAE1 family hydrophobic/amphiphilic exporter-1
LITLLIFALSVLHFSYLSKKEFMPKVDQGQFIIKVNLTPGSTLGATDNVVKIVENELSRIEDVKDITVNIGSVKKETSKDVLKALAPHQGQVVVGLKNRRRNSTEDVIQILKDKLESQNLGSAELEFVLQESVLESALQQGAPIVLEVKGNDINKLKEIVRLVKQGVKDIRGIYGMRDSSSLPSPETKVRVQKDKAAFYGLSVSDVAFAAQTAIEGRVASKFKEAGEEIDIKVRLRNEDRKDLNKVRRLILKTPTDMNMPISEVAYIVKGKGPTEIQHQDQQRVIFVSAYIYKRSLNSVVKDINRAISKINIPANYSITVAGENLKMRESFASLRFALILSTVLIYMIMASQFESFLQPFIIMFTIPLSVIGISLAILLTNTGVSIMVMLGAIILGGIVVNNGIVLLDYVNELKKEGKNDYDAVVEASDVRFRPIMMTAATTVLGVLPLAMTSPLQAPMAVAIMGGLTVSTFLSLIVIPAIFLTLVDFQKKWAKTPA